MALITCPECGKSVSDVAKTCPSCGYPLRRQSDLHEEMDAYTERQGNTYERQDNPYARLPRMQDDATSYGLIGFVMSIIGLVLPIPVLDVLVCMVALILSIHARTNQKDRNPGLAIAGIVIASVGIVIGLGWFMSMAW